MAFWNRLFKHKSEAVTSDEAINVVQSIAKAKVLYKSLCIKCHPDKFSQHPEKMQIAEEIFKGVARNKHNYSALLELEKRIADELYS